MKTGFVMRALAIGLLAAAMTGTVVAGERLANAADPERATLDPWTAQFAIETGALPDAPGGSSGEDRMVSGGAEVPVTEAGAMRYRVGLDTGP